jgi:hypothetical protein
MLAFASGAGVSSEIFVPQALQWLIGALRTWQRSPVDAGCCNTLTAGLSTTTSAIPSKRRRSIKSWSTVMPASTNLKRCSSNIGVTKTLPGVSSEMLTVQ